MIAHPLRLPFAALGTTVLILLLLAVPGRHAAEGEPMPEFKHHDRARWLNSEPLARADLLGQVVLIEIWTSVWINCIRSFPWVHGMIERFADRGLRVISVHTPEFAYEKEREVVQSAIRRHQLEQPVYMDNEREFWRDIGNRYWPTFYLVDRTGIVRLRFVGEMHNDTDRAKRFERIAEELLAEPVPRKVGAADGSPGTPPG